MTELVEKESATELLLEAKGFTDVVVNLTGETADIVVPMKEVTEEQRAPDRRHRKPVKPESA